MGIRKQVRFVDAHARTKSRSNRVAAIMGQLANYAEQPAPPLRAEDYLEMLPSARGFKTRRESEFPYRYPPSMIREISPSNPLNVERLELDKTYLWLVDSDGKIRVALEKDPGFRATYKGDPEKVLPKTAAEAADAALAKACTTVRHGDLQPGKMEDGVLKPDTDGTYRTYRGPSRVAGELIVREESPAN